LITLLILSLLIATVAVTINFGLLGLVVYLSRRRKRALKAVDTLNNAVYSLSVDKAYLLAQQQQRANPVWLDKGNGIVH